MSIIPLGGLGASSSSSSFLGALEASMVRRRSAKPRLLEDSCGVEDSTPLSSSARLPTLDSGSKFQSKARQSLGPMGS